VAGLQTRVFTLSSSLSLRLCVGAGL